MQVKYKTEKYLKEFKRLLQLIIESIEYYSPVTSS